MNKLKELRNEFNYTVREISVLISIDRTTISDYENGNRKLTSNVLISFSNLYQVTIDYLLCHSDLGIYVIDEDKKTLLLDDKKFKELLKNKKIVYIDRKRHLIS